MPSLRRASLEPGIYDELITERDAQALRALPPGRTVHKSEVRDASTVAVLAGAFVREALDLALREPGSPDEVLALARQVLAVLHTRAPRTFRDGEELGLTVTRLEAICAGADTPPERPRGSLHAASLLVNAEGDTLLDNLRSEFATADRVDLLCSFVKLSGFERLRRAIEEHLVHRARPLRVLTTTYMGATDAAAVERLAGLGAEVKVSYDETTTRLHAKAWVFHRASGYSTAYVGSSNLSHAAQTDGLEWNVRVTRAEQPALYAQIEETFAQYWSDRHLFERFDPTLPPARKRLADALSRARGTTVTAPGALVEIEPKDFQKPVLEELAAARMHGRHRNLLVAATGTGKTVMAALDYRALRDAGAVDSLLYVAHRREILEQARHVFRNVLQVGSFGELLFQGERPSIGRHVFASLDSLGGGAVDPRAFSHVILDEAHHAAARSWDELLTTLNPTELVGLTATPERADGLDYERHFPRPWVGNLRVWNAIPHALVPFRYYMLDVDGVDLRSVAWSAGRYAPDALAGKLVGAAEVFVQRAVRAVREHVARPDDLRALAFCSNVRHAEEVCRRLVEQGFRARVLSASTEAGERRDARTALDAGDLQILCVVDLYNEGVDVPNVNALFFFRPTESATVFLQQLGRGLRRARNKSELVVFDLTATPHRSFRFDRRLRGTTGHTPRELREFVATGFGRLPSGCFFHFAERAREAVLDQIRRAIPDDLHGLRELLREPAHASLGLADFLHETDVPIADLYGAKRSWSELRAQVGLDRRDRAEGERDALANVHKLLHVGDPLRLDAWSLLVEGRPMPDERARRAARMLFAVLYGKGAAVDGSAEARWTRDDVLRGEIAELIPVLRSLNATLTDAHVLEPEVPLVLHARYLGVELSAAFDDRTKDGALRDYYTGVEAVAGRRYDMLLTTLEKTASVKEHLRYRDFPLSETLFHWQSKARTTRASPEGRRHLDPATSGCTPLLFVRERNDARPNVTMAFRYLGPVDPVSSEGERPLSMTWRLRYPMPAELLRVGRIAA